jgi:D-lactate dehydrogenase
MSLKLAFFDARDYDRSFFERANQRHGFSITYFQERLHSGSLPMAWGHDCVCAFVNDQLNGETLHGLAQGGVGLIALRCAGFNQVDLPCAASLGLRVLRVPGYSPQAVAEHATALVLALNRKIHRAYARVRECNFSLEGLVGFDLHGKTVGLVGLGRIGLAAARIFRGFGCQVLASDKRTPPEAAELGLSMVPLDSLLASADIVSLHVPLTPETHHLIDERALGLMKRGAMLINTGRGALVDSRALIQALKKGTLGAAGLDVYEEEEGLFFHDLSCQVLQDDQLARLLTFPNVLITAHQGFLTEEALSAIAETTLANVQAYATAKNYSAELLENEVRAPGA